MNTNANEMNKTELNQDELEMVNGGTEREYNVSKSDSSLISRLIEWIFGV